MISALGFAPPPWRVPITRLLFATFESRCRMARRLSLRNGGFWIYLSFAEHGRAIIAAGLDPHHQVTLSPLDYPPIGLNCVVFC